MSLLVADHALVAGHAVLANSAVLADSDTGKGSPIGLFVVLLLVIAVYFLYRSLSRHIRNLPESFDEPADPAIPGTAADSNPANEPAQAALKKATAPNQAAEPARSTGPAGSTERRGQAAGEADPVQRD